MAAPHGKPRAGAAGGGTGALRTATALGLLLALATALAAGPAGCGRREPPARATKVWPTGAACLTALRAQGVRLQGWAAPAGGACRVDTPVAVAGGASTLAPALNTTCSMAFAWAGFEREVDRLARDHLGAGLARTLHMGSYACRRMTGSSGRLSLHASGRALDIRGFALADGRVVEVRSRWSAWGGEGRFLRAVAAAACRHFSATLTPNTDRWHQDHIHVDIGPWRVCGA
ncbi:MAG TPA: extensin family protein [Geminicoccaceae bacterium]|nr:extensin family protein [Geminicoccaceae bacterium]